jgi:hypothetical protein
LPENDPSDKQRNASQHFEWIDRAQHRFSNNRILIGISESSADCRRDTAN